MCYNKLTVDGHKYIQKNKIYQPTLTNRGNTVPTATTGKTGTTVTRRMTGKTGTTGTTVVTGTILITTGQRGKRYYIF